MTVEIVLKMKRSHSDPDMLRGCLVCSGVFRWLVVFLLFAFSVALFLFIASFLSLPISLLAVSLLFLANGLLPPAFSSISLPTLPTLLRSAGADSSFMDAGVAVAEIFGELWVIGWRQRRKSWRNWPEILRAERSSNSYPIVAGMKAERSSNLGRKNDREETLKDSGGTLSLRGPAASEGHGVVGAVCERFRGLGL